MQQLMNFIFVLKYTFKPKTLSAYAGIRGFVESILKMFEGTVWSLMWSVVRGWTLASVTA